VESGFPKRSWSNKKLERDADPTITHPALAARKDRKEQAGDRDSGTVIDPARLIDHEALSRVREIARALPHENEAGHQKNDRHDNQELAHT